MTGTSRGVTRVILTASIVAGALATQAPNAAFAGQLPVKRAYLTADPVSGRAGSMVTLKGSGFTPYSQVWVWFVDATGTTPVAGAQAGPRGRIVATGCVPWNAAPGRDAFLAGPAGSKSIGEARASASFTVILPLPAQRPPLAGKGPHLAGKGPPLAGNRPPLAATRPPLAGGGGTGQSALMSICV